MIFFKILVLVLEMAVLERFWWKHSQKPLGVKIQFKQIYEILSFLTLQHFVVVNVAMLCHQHKLNNKEWQLFWQLKICWIKN